MKACPDCKNETKLSQGALSLCEHCDEWVLPIEIKAPKSLNYKERNSGKFSSLPKSTTKLKPMSKKLNIKLRAYNQSKPLGPEESCVRCNSHMNLERHHPFGRSATINGVNAIELWIWLCNGCHAEVHANANWAMENGYLQPEYRNQILNSERKTPWIK